MFKLLAALAGFAAASFRAPETTNTEMLNLRWQIAKVVYMAKPIVSRVVKGLMRTAKGRSMIKHVLGYIQGGLKIASSKLSNASPMVAKMLKLKLLIGSARLAKAASMVSTLIKFNGHMKSLALKHISKKLKVLAKRMK